MKRHGKAEVFFGKCITKHTGIEIVKPSTKGERWHYELELLGLFAGIQGITR